VRFNISWFDTAIPVTPTPANDIETASATGLSLKRSVALALEFVDDIKVFPLDITVTNEAKRTQLICHR